MEGIVEQVYLSLFVKLVMWKMERNRDTMGRLIHGGALYSSPRLSQLDLKNQRLGMQLHATLLRLLVLRAIESEKRGRLRSVTCERQKHLLTLYGGSASPNWNCKSDVT